MCYICKNQLVNPLNNTTQKERNLVKKSQRAFLSLKHFGCFESQGNGAFNAIKLTIKMEDGVFKETEEKLELKMEKGEKFLTWVSGSFKRGKVGSPSGFFYIHKQGDDGVEHRVSKKDFLTVRKNSLPIAEFPS